MADGRAAGRGWSIVRLALAEPRYRRYVAGNSISLIGNWIQRTAVGWLTWELTGSATWLGLVAFADLFPAILIGPFAGVLADRLPRQRIMLAVQSVMMGLSVVMAGFAWAGWLGPWWLLALTFLHGALVGVNQPARLAMVSILVPPHLLATAIAINGIVFNGARFIGPAFAGVLITTTGMGWTFFINALTYLALIAALLSIAWPAAENAPARPDGWLGALREGYDYVAGHDGIRPILLTFVVAAVLVRPLGELLPAFAEGVFGRGAIGLAWLSGALGIGAAVGGYWLATHPATISFRRFHGWMLTAAACTVAFALARPFELAVVAAMMCGFSFVVSGAGTQAIIQAAVPDALRGRVMSLFGVVLRAAPAIGALMLGAAADRLGIALTVAGGAIAYGLLSRHPRLRTTAAADNAIDRRRPTP